MEQEPLVTAVDHESVTARLDELQRASLERRAELQALSAAVPAATSRRALVRAMAGSVARAPDKGDIVARAWRRVLRTPGELVSRWRKR